MTIRTLAGAGVSALLVASVATLSLSHGAAPAVATARVDPKDAKAAADCAADAQRMLAKKQWDKAVKLAEEAVGLNGQDAGYRALLGAAYLRAGRFASAEQAYRDVITLQPDNGRAALNLALAQIGTGKWDEARVTLDAHAETIAPADRGLAIALAGDPAGAVEVLTVAARSAEADAKTRQNLALAYAMAGRWAEARALVSVDLDAGAVDARLGEWASFVRPRSASDQVASLLGVTPVVDPGQPVALALAGTVPVTTAETVDAFMPGRADPAVETAVVADAAASAEPAEPAVAMAPAVPVAPAPARVIAAQPAGYKVAPAPRRAAAPAPAAAAVRMPAKGDWFVQLGAYQNAAVAKDGWGRAARRLPVLARLNPNGATATVKGASVYRLSVGGFARTDAVALCRGLRARGGPCFVRGGVGEQNAAWHKASPNRLAKTAPRGKGAQLAAR